MIIIGSKIKYCNNIMCCYYIMQCLFTKPKEKVKPSLLRKSSYIHSQIPISSPRVFITTKIEYDDSMTYQLT